MSPVMTKRRIHAYFVVLLLVFNIFGARLFQIQGLDAAAYAAMAKQAGTASSTIPAPRGRILDRNGVELATTLSGKTLTADPSMTASNAPRIARILMEELGDEVDYFTLIDKLRTPNSRYVYLTKQLPKWEADKALTAVAEAGFAGVFGEAETLRSYPGGSLAANLLGYLNGSGEGVSGLEQQYNDLLTGTDGSRSVEIDPTTGERIPMGDNTVTEAVPGSDVVTTIDRDLQWYSDQRLAEAVRATSSEYGLAITMDLKTGQLVQMSQAPTFNADTRSGLTDGNTVSRAVQNVYEPGSVLKTVTMAALADQGKISAETPIVVPSSMTIDDFEIGDYWDHGTLHLTAAGVIALSSNLGTIVASQQMTDETMDGYLRDFGFGKKSGINLPGESAGILKDGKDWSEANHATISFGQGISVTALQVVKAIGAIANGGVMVDPTVVTSTINADGDESPVEPPSSKRVVSKQAASIVTRMMEAVTADNGTAPAAQIDGYRVAGKTGTAWRVNPVTGRYVRGQNTVSFVGFAPADKPRFVTYVVLDNPYAGAGGGSTAGPVFHDIMSMALERFGVAPTGAKSPTVDQDW